MIASVVGGEVVQLGDGVTATTEWADGRCECTFCIFGEEVAVAYVDDDGLPRVDFHERTHVGVDAFKRTLVIFAMAWSKAEQLSVMWHSKG